MIREAAITPKNENSGLKPILTNIWRLLSLTERKNPVHNFFHQYPPLGKPGFVFANSKVIQSANPKLIHPI